MNGQMYQICSIVAASKKAIQFGELIKYTPKKYENTIRFMFLPEKKLFGTKKYLAPDVSEWFKYIKKKGLQDIKFICPLTVKNRQFLGFSNTSESSILCFFKDNKVSYFVPDWQFNSEKKQWNILYSEHEWLNPPLEKPRFENNTESFRKILTDIQNFAAQIECEDFAHIFESAQNLLNCVDKYPDKEYGIEFIQIPNDNLQIFKAASLADVFGAMGSWNDSPPYMAHEKGLDKEYENLSNELLENIRLAILYAINEW